MRLPKIPGMNIVDPILERVLSPVRQIVHSLAFGIPQRRMRAVTFQDLIDMGKITESEADSQLETLE